MSATYYTRACAYFHWTSCVGSTVRAFADPPTSYSNSIGTIGPDSNYRRQFRICGEPSSGCTYSNPQVASVGLTETAAKANGRSIKVGRFPYQGNGKAIALGEPEGLVKTIFDAKTGELLGAHMIGAEVTELIQGFGLAKTLETTEAELMEAIFPHPTLSEMMHESVLDAYGRVIHI